jgi:hypothetical protein
MRRLPLACAATCALMLYAADANAALCGDTSGNGFLAASDARATLRLAVTSGYDRRGDVVPAGGNDRITAVDALESLKAAVEGRIPHCSGPAISRVAVTTAPYDFSGIGGFAVVDIETRAFHYRSAAVSSDAVIRVPRGMPVVVNRKNYNTLELLDTEESGLDYVSECSVADGFDSNPQDVLLLSDEKGYVTAYAGGNLLVIDPRVLFEPGLDPSCGGIITGRIDLSAYDGDGIPQMDQMVTVGSNLFVTMQLLDDAAGFEPKGPGAIAVIDTATDTVKGTIPLSFANPFAQTKGLVFDEFQQLIFAGGPGKTGDTLDDGGIEAIDPATMSSAGVLLTGADLGANIYDFVVVGTQRVFAIIADDVSNSVVDIDLASRSVRKVLVDSIALITDIEMTERGELWVAYRGETSGDPPGLRIFRVTDDKELTAKPVHLGQAPFTLALFD